MLPTRASRAARQLLDLLGWNPIPSGQPQIRRPPETLPTHPIPASPRPPASQAGIATPSFSLERGRSIRSLGPAPTQIALRGHHRSTGVKRKRELVTQSSHLRDGKDQADGKVILLQRDREFSEFVAVLTELDVPAMDCLSGLPTQEEIKGARLVIATAERLLDSGPPHLSQWPRTLAVIQNPSKTLSTHLSRIGVTMILHRPVHPRALRLLLLHELYRGPEKRERGRTLIGQSVRVGSGLFGTKGMLIDLAPSSARLQLTKALKLASTLRVQLGRELTQGPPLKLKARVVRCSTLPDQSGYEVGLWILDARSNQEAIQSILDRFASGPANWGPEPTDGQSAVGSAVDTDSPDQTPKPLTEPKKVPALPAPAAARRPARSQSTKPRAQVASSRGTRASFEGNAPKPHAPLASSRGTDASLEGDTQEIETQDVEPTERRTQQRVPYDHRVVALDEEAARVLLACDLSIGGMRIVSKASLPMGSVLRIAVHSGAETEPLVLMSRVIRDDGPDGIVLAFEKLDPRQREVLEKMIASKGQICEASDPDSAQSELDDSLVIGELIDEVDFENAIEDVDSLFDADESIEGTF